MTVRDSKLLDSRALDPELGGLANACPWSGSLWDSLAFLHADLGKFQFLLILGDLGTSREE